MRLLRLPPALLLLAALAGCSPRAYERVPPALGLPYAERTVTETQVTIAKDGHTFVFGRGKRPATVDGVRYYLHRAAGINTLNSLDATLLRQAVVCPAPVRPRLTLMLDPGHGGADTGCRVGGVHEKQITLAIATAVAQRLRAQGHTVLLTRDADATNRTLDERTLLAAGAPLDAFVSIHVNSAANPEAKGAEVYTLPAPGCEGTNANSPPRGPLAGHAHLPMATRLALGIQRALLALPAPSPADRGVRHAHFKVLRDVPAPSVLVETGFLTNAEDFARLTSPEGQQALATAIAQGITSAFATH